MLVSPQITETLVNLTIFMIDEKAKEAKLRFVKCEERGNAMD